MKRILLPLSILLLTVALPTTTLLAAERHGPPSFEHTHKYWTHFIAFVLLMYFLLRKPFNEFWVSRAAEIEHLATEGERKLAEANVKLAAAKDQLAALQSDIAKLKERGASEAENEYQAILSEGTARSDMIAAQADTTIKSEKLQQELELQNEFASQVISSARQKLSSSLSADEDKALRESVLKGLGSLQ